MPLYEYKCVGIAGCGAISEQLEHHSAPTSKNCTECNKGTMERQISLGTFKFNDGQWRGSAEQVMKDMKRRGK